MALAQVERQGRQQELRPEVAVARRNKTVRFGDNYLLHQRLSVTCPIGWALYMIQISMNRISLQRSEVPQTYSSLAIPELRLYLSCEN